MGWVATENSRASSASRTLGASSRLNTRRARRTVHRTFGRGQVMSHCRAAARRNPISNPALWATKTELPANSKNIGRTALMTGRHAPWPW
ncbi:putative dNA polymerase III, epsilon subunit [Mycobacterium kansasii]|uniref:Putative dNA polymerase III, epsilon subunit n=1 Tax=Mycobacterium kansasii TaxID=1768 RepID=A0A1V3WZD9_MYCKA|nr:putative dNA polymerase III, epsilon subunit [Mycobacterium kansasii]